MVEAKSDRSAEERRLEREKNRAFLADAIEGFGDQTVHDALAKRLDAALASLEQS